MKIQINFISEKPKLTAQDVIDIIDEYEELRATADYERRLRDDAGDYDYFYDAKAEHYGLCSTVAIRFNNQNKQR